MPVSLAFADSFAHYNDTSLKWSTGGGVFETNLAHVRTGARSLKIQSGNAPSLNLNQRRLVTGGILSQFVVGTAWQTSVLSGETICELWAFLDDNLVPLPTPLRQFFLIQNANGSISVWTGNAPTPTLIGTTAAGVLTVGPFWYIELTVDMIAGTLALTVTSAAAVAVQVLLAIGFVTSSDHIDQILWGGPTGGNFAWVDDFYVGSWDGLAPGIIGAPKIYGAVVPNADGLTFSFNGPAFPVSAPPWFPQVNSIPQNTGLFISREDDGGTWPPQIDQSFDFDVSSVPPGSTVAALQVVHLLSLDHDKFNNVPQPCAFMGFTGGAVSDYLVTGNKAGLVNSPFLFYCFQFDHNPLTGAPWTVAQFTGPTAFQIGPAFQEPG